MAALASHLRLRDLGYSFLFAGFLTAACGGKSADAGDGGDTTSGKGGSNGATGGTSATGVGGSQGGTSDHENGGDTSSAGTADLGGSSGSGVGGTGGTVSGKGGADVAGTGGSSDTPCKDVVCAPIPETCTKIVQEPGACCPTCPDTGCDPCIAIGCGTGTHPETAPGDCCPTCVADPPDACEQGRAAYAQMREALIDKYGSVGCKNSSECGLVQVENACEGFECPVALPSTAVQNYASNLESAALGCASCPSAKLPPMLCMPVIAACVNGFCTAQPQ